MGASGPSIRRFVGIYHANGGLRGEFAYAVGKVLGTAHCALCDITHSGVRRKRSWTELVAGFGVPVLLLHLNERIEAIARASADRTPCVLAETDDGLVELLGPDALALVDGDVTRFGAALRAAVATAGLRWPPPDQQVGPAQP